MFTNKSISRNFSVFFNALMILSLLIGSGAFPTGVAAASSNSAQVESKSAQVSGKLMQARVHQAGPLQVVTFAPQADSCTDSCAATQIDAITSCNDNFNSSTMCGGDDLECIVAVDGLHDSCIADANAAYDACTATCALPDDDGGGEEPPSGGGASEEPPPPPAAPAPAPAPSAPPAAPGPVPAPPPAPSCEETCTATYDACIAAAGNDADYQSVCASQMSGCMYSCTVVNSAPVITEDASTVITMSQNGSPTPFDLTLFATNADGDPLTWSIVTPAGHGTATTTLGTGDSNVIGYTPTTDYVGPDSFDVQVSDGELTDTTTVNVSITANPVSCATCTETHDSCVMGAFGDPDVIAICDAQFDSCNATCVAPPPSCTDSCAATQTDAIAWCNANFDPAAVCGGDAACEAEVIILRDQCIADTNTAYSACTATCEAPTPVDQTITVTIHAPTSAVIGNDFTVEAAASSNLPVSYSSSGACTNVGADFTMTSDTGDCTVIYDQAGNANFNPAPQVTEVVTAQPPVSCATCDQNLADAIASCYTSLDISVCGGDAACEAEVVILIDQCIADANTVYDACAESCVMPTPVDQTITVITHAPATASAGDVFTVEAIASSGLPVSYSRSGDCTNTGSTFTFFGIKGDSCFVHYNQTGDENYNPAPQVIEEVTFVHATPVITEGESIEVVMAEDGDPVPFALTLHATDAENDVLSWNIATPALHGIATKAIKSKCDGKKDPGKKDDGKGGRVSVISCQEFGYLPAINYYGTDSFDVQVSDGTLTDTITVIVKIKPYNDAPVITESDPLELTMSQNGSPTAFDLILHATDIESDPLTWSIISPASYGTATTTSGTGDSNVIGYIPNDGFTGQDSFYVEVSDGELTAGITVNVTVRPVLTITADSQTISYGDAEPTFTFAYNGFIGEDNAGNIDVPPTCAVNGAHTNAGSYPIVCSGGSDDQYDFVYVNSILTITKAEQSISVTTSAPTSASSGQIFNVSASASSGLAVSYSALGSCTNVGATFTITNGVGTCTLSYDQVGDTNYNPAPQVTEVVGDANDAPVITEGASVPVTMFEDGPASFSLTLHATDPDGNTLTWSIATPASHGVAVASGTGLSKAISYSPHTNYNGSDSFVVQVSDGSLTDTITVNIAITAVNDTPTFTKGPDQTVNEDAGPQTVLGWATNISPGPADESGQTVFIGISENTNPALFAAGPAVNATTGNLTYTPAANASGSAIVSVTIGDNGGSANGGIPFGPKIPFVITVNAINDAPVITEGASIPITMSEDIPAFSFTLNATDADGNTLTWSIATSALHGSTNASGTGLSKSIGYTPNPNYNGTDSFVVKVSDGLLTDTITVDVTVSPVNDAPVITEGTSVAVSMSQGGSPTPFNLILHATDVDNGISNLTWSISSLPSHGLAAVVMGVSGASSTGTINYTPNTGYNGTDSFDVRVTDGSLADIITVNVTIMAVNVAPVITEGTSVSVSMSQGGFPNPYSLILHATDIDSGITSLTWSISSAPLHGSASVVTGASSTTGSTGTTSYTPNTGYNGTDSFDVRVTDGSLADIITVNVTVRPVLTITANPQSITYGDPEPNFTYTVAGFVGTDGVTNTDRLPTCSRLGAFSRNVGTYRIGCSGGDDDKYDFRYVDNDLTITPKPITVRPDANQRKEYGTADPVLTYHITSGSLLAGDGFSGNLTRTPGENVGDYDILQGALTAGNNYNLTYIPGQKLTINRKPITVTANPQSKAYGTIDPALTYQGALLANDSFSGNLTRASGENVGSYVISQGTLSAGNNYMIQFISSSLTITARPIAVTADALSKVYGDIDPSLTYQVTSGALLSTDSLIGNLTRASGENVGSYVISQGTLTAGNNYNIQFIPGSLTITAKSIDVTADPQTIMYGDADPAFTFSYGSFAAGDGPSNINTPPICSVSGAHTDAGSYPIVCSGGADDQYDFIYVSDTLTITQLSLTVTADAQSKVYGASDPALTYQVTSGALLSADSFNGDLVRASGENVNVYAIAQGTLSAGGNYNLTFVGADFTITKADQTITVTINAPANAAIGSTFTVAATASSGLPVSYNSSGTCTNIGATFTKTSGTGACIVNYDQAGDTNYNPAPQISQAVAVSGGGAPSLLTPANGEHLLTNRPTFDWTDVPAAVSYTIQISGNSGFTGSPTSNTVTLSTFTQPTNLPVNVTRYWRVQATTSAGAGPWSAVRSFITGNPPSAPALTSPGNNALVTDYTPLLDWNDTSMPTGTNFLKYEIQIATDSAFTSPTNVDATNSNYTPSTDLNSNTTYYWQVRTYNTLGQYGPWSTRHFRTALLPPTLTTPNNAEQLLNNRPTFDWADVPGATSYRIEISADPINFTSPITAKNVTPSSFTPTADLPVGITLYWRVQSKGTNGPSDWSVRMLTTANPPSVPTLISPANNAKVSGPSPLFDWSDSIITAGVVFDHYQIQVATDTAFITIIYDHNVFGISNSQDNNAVLAPATTYSWRVRSVNAMGGYSAWSTVRTVKIKFAGPTLILPTSGSTVSSLIPTFTWNAVSGATDYTIQVSKSPTFGSFAINKTAISSTYTHTANLKAGTTYYWRVRVKSPTTYGAGDWSQVFTFTTP